MTTRKSWGGQTTTRALICCLALLLIFSLALPRLARAQPTSPDSFSLIVAPSPIVATVNPGQVTTEQLKIINNAGQPENLQIGLRSFSFNNTTGQIKFSDSVPSDVSSWVSFDNPKFTLDSGQMLNEQIKLAIPKDAGFSYSFAVVISRQNTPASTSSGQVLKGALADFMLLNVNRPGAVRSLKVESFTANRHLYSWLPVNFSIRFKNTGNTIVQPNGNIFIQRSRNSKTPIDTFAVNPGQGYILPGTDRTITAAWSDGFPVYKTIANAIGTSSQRLTWNWADLSKLRLGRYYAELVAIYNNGHQDIPVQGQVSFWVLPWALMLILALVLLLILFAIWTIAKKIIRTVQKHLTHKRRRT
jgi:hypothetical protein